MIKNIAIKILSCIILMLVWIPAKAQFPILDINFDNYAGTTATVPAGIFISWNSASPASFYTSTGNFGLAAPSYKFGNDSDYVVTKFMTNIDSVRFWMKGNGTPLSPANELRFYYSIDSLNYTLFHTIDSLPSTGTNYIFYPDPVQIAGNIKIEYGKAPAGGNLAFDDLVIYSSIAIGVEEELNKNTISIFPSPSAGLVNIRIPNGSVPQVEVFNMLGKKMQVEELQRKDKGIFTLNLNKQNPGFYFIKIRYGNELITKRITLTE